MTGATETIAVIGTITVYLFSKKLYLKWYTPFTVPIITSTIMIILLLKSISFSYEEYMSGAIWIDKLLGPAVVALAIPLYRQLHLIKRYSLPIGAGVGAGVIIGMMSGFGLAHLFGIEEMLIRSLVAKSVTTPVATEITRMLGGIPAVAAVYVMVAGISGAMFGAIILKLFRINHFIGRGIGFGSAAHGIGTAKALELGEKEAAISSVAMTLSAILSSFIAPLLLKLLIH